MSRSEVRLIPLTEELLEIPADLSESEAPDSLADPVNPEVEGNPPVDFPICFVPLFEPHRFKVFYGGRGGAKSWAFARALLLLGNQRPLRILCARETMKSIAGSVHQLLKDQIRLMGLSGWIIEKSHIRFPHGKDLETVFTFEGLHHNVENIKSTEAVDIVWVFEAASVAKESWDTLIPTIRKDKCYIHSSEVPSCSEIWIDFNPVFDDDDTFKRFVVDPPASAAVVKVGWRDNPWFPETLRVDRDDCQIRDPKGFLHIWEGECRSTVEGAIFGSEMLAAESDGRIGNVPYDRTKPVTTIWDLGFGDKTAIWFVQPYDGWYNLIDYLEDNGRTIEWYLIQLQQKGYLYDVDWLPHDGVDTIIHHRMASGDRSRSIESIMRGAGRNVRIVPKLYVSDRINAARTILPQCRFNRDKCDSGLRALRMYQWGALSAKGTAPREPLHDAASHGADAFCGLAVAVKQTKAPVKKEPPKMTYRPQTYSPFA